MFELSDSAPTYRKTLLNKAPSGIPQLLYYQGFKPATQKQQIQQIKAFLPEGETRLFDSVISNCKSFIKIYQQIKQRQDCQKWKFYFILFCDGRDTDSRNSLKNAQNQLIKLNQLFSNQDQFSFYSIGIDLNERAFQHMQPLTKCIGKQNKFYNIKFYDIQPTIAKIKAQINPIESNQNQRRVICFDIDPSGSMIGRRWRQVYQGIQQIQTILTANDYSKIVTFNQNLGYIPQNKNLQVEILADQPLPSSQPRFNLFFQNQSQQTHIKQNDFVNLAENHHIHLQEPQNPVISVLKKIGNMCMNGVCIVFIIVIVVIFIVLGIIVKSNNFYYR